MNLTEKITVTNEDNMKLMARYPDNHFDLAIVDPPYKQGNKNSSFTSTDKNLTKGFAQLTLDHGNKTKCDLGNRPTQEYFKELQRVSKNQIIWGGNFFSHHLPPHQCVIIWDKYRDNENLRFGEFEIAFTSFNSRTRVYGKGFFSGVIGKIHPTEKPVHLYEWILYNYASKNKPSKDYNKKRNAVKILDTHLGSGSIALACHNLKFDLTACELDKDYFEAAINRLETHISIKRINF